ncbi:MAG: PIN domain-containing protein [Eggerthellaceae bacterium]|nr:PIN domain-containing protein [Eggerthellaceae bacterium]
MSKLLCILVDTNVWIDNYAPVRKESERSRQLIDMARNNGASLVYPVHVLKDVFYNLSATNKRRCMNERGELSEADYLAIRELSWACIENMADLAFAVGADQSDVWLARKYRSFSNDLEDNFVMAAAERANADFIVTRDEKLLRKSSVKAFTPEDALAFLELNTAS